MPKPTAQSAVAALCPACGMCCNGVLFADVRLQSRDNPKLLAKLGLKLEPHGKALHFCQPCTAFDGTLCRVYENRPQRCRTFECRLLKSVAAGKTTSNAALKTIGKMHARTDRVLALLDQLGNTDSHLPITHRYQAVISQPWDLGSGDAVLALRSQLMRAVDDLMTFAHQEFLR